MSDAKKYWDGFYEEKVFSGGKAPNSFLLEMLPRLQKGKALDIAMGEGNNSVYLAQKGFQVKGFDISKTAVERATKLALDTGVEVDLKCADMDLYLMGLMEYDSIIMTYFRPPTPRYYSEMIRALKQGGTILIESYGLSEMTEAIGKEDMYKNFYFPPNELLKHLQGLRILFYQEGEVDGRDIVQCLAQKPIDKDAIKYNLFDMHSKQKDTAKSKQLELAEKFFKKKD